MISTLVWANEEHLLFAGKITQQKGLLVSVAYHRKSRLTTVWPDVGVKSCPIFCKSCPKVSTSV